MTGCELAINLKKKKKIGISGLNNCSPTYERRKKKTGEFTQKCNFCQFLPFLGATSCRSKPVRLSFTFGTKMKIFFFYINLRAFCSSTDSLGNYHFVVNMEINILLIKR